MEPEHEKKIRLVMVRMDEELRKLIEEECQNTGETMSDVIRRCVRKELKK